MQRPTVPQKYNWILVALLLVDCYGEYGPSRLRIPITPDSLPNLNCHKLDAVARHLGFTFKHHDALEDAITCAKIIAHVGVPVIVRKLTF
jgi:hypothetical protein